MWSIKLSRMALWKATCFTYFLLLKCQWTSLLLKEALEQQFLPINENQYQWSRHFNRSSGSVSHKLSWPQKNWLVQISCRSSGQIQPPLCHQDIHCWVHVRTPYFNSTALQPRFRELFISKRNFYPWIWWKLKHWCKFTKIL